MVTQALQASAGKVYVIVRLGSAKDIIAISYIWLVRCDDEGHDGILIGVGQRNRVGTFTRFVASAHRAGTGTLSI